MFIFKVNDKTLFVTIYFFIIFQARITEAEECIDGLNSKVTTTEKLRSRYQMDLDELHHESERINTHSKKSGWGVLGDSQVPF